MTSILQELQAGYDQRARMALQAPVSPATVTAPRKATRTYTGPALARRRAWGQTWGAILKAAAHDLRKEGETSV